MYPNHNHSSPASPPPDFSNNPFINDPTNAYARFPDLSGSTLPPGSPQFPPQFQPGYSNGYGDPAHHQSPQAHYQQYPPQPYVNQYQAQPQVPEFPSTSYAPQPSPMIPQPTGYMFQPTSSFGQQLQSHPQQYGVQAGYQNQQHPGYQGHPQQAGNPGYFAEFDPYSQLSQSQNSSQATRTAPALGNAVHPRDFIRLHKAQLDAWDSNTWKQLFSACDGLKDAWSTRKQQAQGMVQQMGGNGIPGPFGSDPRFAYNGQLEGWKQVLNDANNNSDTVAASTFQLHEVYNSYRQSGDPTSKQRVRESCNAALRGLPDWPAN
ncbi:hypothetical protein BU15DRAFT_62470 [Melanogaster broomeanus]|nr:hypothetical protein BU15DRAFT_62470 [Melanogaster broomeanus]